MAGKEFNLLQEPWIRVMREDCSIEEVSLTEALLHAHSYRGLAGELPTQDAAILRLLLAVLHAVFEHVNVAGEDTEIENADDALDHWMELWEYGHFPEDPLRAYLKAQEENFWLFHPTKPFWQISNIPAEASRPQSEPVQKINGAISESGNKARLFSERGGAEKTTLSNAEAARWLVCMNQYDDNTLKSGLGVALLGQFAVIMAQGNTLFETLMLNFVLLDRDGAPWEKNGSASWEEEIKFDESVRKIAYPRNPVAILSYHSRYGQLVRKNGKLEGYKSPKGGLCYEQISHNEQMAIWKMDKKKEKNNLCRSLNRRQVWREFDSIIANKETYSLLIQWHFELIRGQCIQKNIMLRYGFVSITYDQAQHSSVDNIFSDSLSLHLNLLSELGTSYRQRISDMVARCDRIAKRVGILAYDLYLASGGDKEKKIKLDAAAREHYYFVIDAPFRKWLASLDAEDTSEAREQKIDAWCKEADAAAWKLAEKLVADAGQSAFIGKMVSVGNDKKKYYSSSLAMQWFRSGMRNIDRV
ncbi:MAG: type I-E CRISPR-associated protein Cse1/CasA [Clostridiales bacterium]|nr:type I-E CRISPR-associated protein Cse1/CasA [Candidatus Cacconaster stercorequi]